MTRRPGPRKRGPRRPSGRVSLADLERSSLLESVYDVRGRMWFKIRVSAGGSWSSFSAKMIGASSIRLMQDHGPLRRET